VLEHYKKVKDQYGDDTILEAYMRVNLSEAFDELSNWMSNEKMRPYYAEGAYLASLQNNYPMILEKAEEVGLIQDSE
jgi:hypothetical protein